MAYFVNRTPPARLRCLQYLLKTVYFLHGKKEFTMSEAMFNKDEKNIKDYCELLINDKKLCFSYCPFLDNPLSTVGCYLTKSIINDSTKKKEISNTINSLEGLGFLNRNGRMISITDLGIDFVKTKFNSHEWRKIARSAMLNYGPFIGLLYQIYSRKDDVFSARDIFVGYPKTEEVVTVGNKSTEISVGSQQDSNTRSKSCFLAWATTGGFIVPKLLSGTVNLETSHIDTNEYIVSNSSRSLAIYKKLDIPDIFFSNFTVNNPLDYNNLIKNIGALRENGQKLSRETTMKFSSIVKNRRLAIVYAMSEAFKKNKKVNFGKLISILKNDAENFVIDKIVFDEVMKKELAISFAVGIPYKIDDFQNIIPATGVNNEVLTKGAPAIVVSYLEKNIDEILI